MAPKEISVDMIPPKINHLVRIFLTSNLKPNPYEQANRSVSRSECQACYSPADSKDNPDKAITNEPGFFLVISCSSQPTIHS